MLTITKRSGREEEFRPEKIQKSLRSAGVSYAMAVKIAGGINYREGITTAQVRNRVLGGISEHEPDAATRYELHRRKEHQQQV